MGIQQRLALAGTLAAAAVALAACDGAYGSEDNSNGREGQRQNSGQQAPAQNQNAPAQTSVLASTQNARLGQIVADGSGRTLYRFDKDTASPSVSNCSGDCAAKWPPVIVPDGQVTVKGINGALVGKTRRADGSYQLTLGGWPLYRFADDTAPGQTNGQGVGGTWFVSAPEGKKAAQPSQPANPPGQEHNQQPGYGY